MHDDAVAAGPTSVAAAIERSLGAYDELLTLGEEIEDEWGYVNDLAAAWRDRLGAAADQLGHETSVSPDAAAAIDAAIEETRRIRDPHRAIDWLSTFPQVVLVALGRRP